MEKNIPKNFGAIWNDAKEYLQLRIELIKLKAIEKGSKLAADLVSNTILVLCLLMAFLALSVTFAFYLSHLLKSHAAGFGCATVFFTLVAGLMVLKKSAIERFVAGVAIRRYFEKYQEAQEEEEAQRLRCMPAEESDHKKPWL